MMIKLTFYHHIEPKYHHIIQNSFGNLRIPWKHFPNVYFASNWLKNAIVSVNAARASKKNGARQIYLAHLHLSNNHGYHCGPANPTTIDKAGSLWLRLRVHHRSSDEGGED